MNTYEDYLNEIRKNYAENPLKKDLYEENDDMDWDGIDPLVKLEETDTGLLYQKGTIHYGCLVQANDKLFKASPLTTAPADIVYSTDEQIDRNPELLAKIAHRIFSYKGLDSKQVPEEFRKIAALITDEMERFFELPVPECATGGIPVYITTVMVRARQLPKWKLEGKILPVIAAPGTTKLVRILPKKYWSKQFIADTWH